jgi:hypothetical protein
MGEVGEVLHEPRCTLLPGSPWVKGVANLRGRLLPIMDLCGFSAELSPLRKQRRVLVVEHGTCSPGCWWMRCSACSTSLDSLQLSCRPWRRHCNPLFVQRIPSRAALAVFSPCPGAGTGLHRRRQLVLPVGPVFRPLL